MKRLMEIQHELNCPKNLHNSFGNYSYRSCEGILEAVKPLLKKHNLVLTIKDEIVDSCGKNYIKATVCLSCAEGKLLAFTTAFAREAEDKKGQDPSQMTGCASSYARKYALNGLFLIDDNKDSDTDEFTLQNDKPKTDRLTDPVGSKLPIYNKPETKKETKVEAKTKVTL